MHSCSLSPSQQEWLQHLWRAHKREFIHVPTENKRKSLIIPPHAQKFCSRLTLFFQTALGVRLGDRENDFPSTTPAVDPRSSSLQEYYKLAVVSGVVRLVEGRHVIVLNQQEFVDDLNRFECQGKSPSSTFLRQESFGAFLYHMPRDAVSVVGVSMALAMATLGPDPSNFVDRTQIIVRLVNVQPEVPMMDIKTGIVGKLVTVKGHVVKARPKRLRVATADFVCYQCGQTSTHGLAAGVYSIPKSCPVDGCRSKRFHFLRPSVRYVNVQDLRLQEAPDESSLQAGRTPRQLEVEMTHDLVDQCRPGDIVHIAAVVAAINTAASKGKKRAQESTTYKLYLIGHSVTTTTMSESTQDAQRNEAEHKTSRSITYTQSQLQSITQLCHADHRYFSLVERRAFPFDLLVRSLCPSIIGHHEVKAGILLCLLGGTPNSDTADTSIRSNSHILIVGDPGMGKSQMLLAASQLAARSVYVGGNTSSTTGLTVTLTKEENGDSGMEAGALVLADQGICCIDEFDKMAKNHQDGLLEAMEQQQVSIAKAGVVASLPARCSIVAAANPRHGSYTQNKSVGENLNMAKPILSRFDLVFILRDRADKDQDRLVSSNIMNLYKQTNHPVPKQPLMPSQVPATNQCRGRIPLSSRISWVNEFQKDALPATLVKDYIAYAREHCKPKLTAEAAVVLKDYFMALRYPDKRLRQNDAVPITTRQLEALIRLCQARAKACLRDFCLKEDAQDVVDLMSRSVDQVHSDDHGSLDRSRGGAGGTSNRKMKKAFANELHRLVGLGGICSLEDLRRIAVKVGCGLNEFQATIEEARSNGILMKKSDGSFQVSAS